MLEDGDGRDEFSDMDDKIQQSQAALNKATQFIRDARKALGISVLATTEKQALNVIAEAQKLTDAATTAVAATIPK